MNPLSLVDSLKQAAKEDPALRDVLLLFATRIRARYQVTLAALSRSMENEKFQHSDAAYAKCLETLATLGIGTLDRDSKGRVRALRGLKYRLPQLGQVVVDKSELIAFKRHPRYRVIYQPLVSPAPQTVVNPVAAKPDPQDRRSGEDRRRAPRSYQTPGTKLVLTYILNGKPINIPVPADLTPTELVILVQKFIIENDAEVTPQPGPTAVRSIEKDRGLE